MRLYLAEELTQRAMATRLEVSFTAIRRFFASPGIRRAIRQHHERARARQVRWADQEAWKFTMPRFHCPCCSQRSHPRVVWPLHDPCEDAADER